MALEYSYIPVVGLLVPLDAMKQRLKIRDSDHDADVSAATAQAQEAILRKMGAAVDATWTDLTAPEVVKAAITLLTQHLYELPDGRDDRDDRIWAAVNNLLAHLRDPTLA